MKVKEKLLLRARYSRD